VTVSGTGSISTINEDIILAEENNAVVEEVLVAVGDTVEEGEDLITFEDDDLDPIEAPFSGEVTTLNVKEEDTVSMGTELIEVTDYNHLEMVVNVDELDISKVKVGQTAKIDVSALL
jgi:HlyD family secretion protein